MDKSAYISNICARLLAAEQLPETCLVNLANMTAALDQLPDGVLERVELVSGEIDGAESSMLC